MKVRATQSGYIYHKRRREGEVFELKPIKGFVQNKDGKNKPFEFTAEQQFSSLWMEKVDDDYIEHEMMQDDQRKRRKRKVDIEQQDISSDDDVI